MSFASAGLKDERVGDTADPRTVAACEARGYDLGAFRCREIGPREAFAASDLILAMDHVNLHELETRRPAGNAAPIKLFLSNQEVPDSYSARPMVSR